MQPSLLKCMIDQSRTVSDKFQTWHMQSYQLAILYNIGTLPSLQTSAKRGRAGRKAAPYDVPGTASRAERRSERVKSIEEKPKKKTFPFPGQVLLAQKWDEERYSKHLLG